MSAGSRCAAAPAASLTIPGTVAVSGFLVFHFAIFLLTKLQIIRITPARARHFST